MSHASRLLQPRAALAAPGHREKDLARIKAAPVVVGVQQPDGDPVRAARFPLTTPWLLTALVLYGLVALVGMFGYTATLRQQIQILDREGLTSPAYHTLAKRGMILGAILAVLVSLIVFLMVVKPRLWG
ncbi:MAG: hypothetical protein C4346_03100 [Chloroflexota bacterium]